MKIVMQTSDQSYALGDSKLQDAESFIVELVSRRKLLKSTLDDPKIIIAFELLGGLLSKRIGGDEQVLRTTAVLARVGSVSKPVHEVVLKYLQKGLSIPLPRIGNWGDAEDHFYIAKAIEASKPDWGRVYAAQELTSADPSEIKPRAIWTSLAIAGLGSLDSLFLEIIEEVDVAQSENETLAARKLIRILNAVEEYGLNIDIELGDDFGKHLLRLISVRITSPNLLPRKLKEDVSDSVISFVISSMRMRANAQFDIDLYRSVASVNRWWLPTSPPNTLEPKISRTAKFGVRALLLLAKQGVKETAFRQLLVSVFGRLRIDDFCKIVSNKEPSSDHFDRKWFLTGRVSGTRKTNEFVKEIAEADLDEMVSRILLLLDKPDSQSGSLERIGEELGILEPDLGYQILSAAKNRLQIEQLISLIANRRNLSLTHHNVGEIVKYNPSLHSKVDTVTIGTQVRVAEPGVEKQQSDGERKIILKSKVIKL